MVSGHLPLTAQGKNCGFTATTSSRSFHADLEADSGCYPACALGQQTQEISQRIFLCYRMHCSKSSSFLLNHLQAKESFPISEYDLILVSFWVSIIMKRIILKGKEVAIALSQGFMTRAGGDPIPSLANP